MRPACVHMTVHCLLFSCSCAGGCRASPASNSHVRPWLRVRGCASHRAVSTSCRRSRGRGARLLRITYTMHACHAFVNTFLL